MLIPKKVEEYIENNTHYEFSKDELNEFIALVVQESISAIEIVLNKEEN